MTNRAYDPREALPPGQVLQRTTEQALVAAFKANGNTPLSPAQAAAAAGPALPYPAGLPRFVNSNAAIDGWAIDAPHVLEDNASNTDDAWWW